MIKRIFCLIAVISFALIAQADTINLDNLSLWAGGTIGLGNYVTIGGSIASGANISAGSGAQLDSIYTQSSVWLGSNSSVSGDIFANGGIQTGSNVIIDGTSNSFSNFILPALDSLEHGAIGTDNIYSSKNSTKTLLAGQYRDWNFDRNTTLNLSAGDYTLRDFWMNKDGVVNVDTSAGDVILNVVGQFSTGSEVSFIKTGSGNLYVNVFGHDIWLDDDVSMNAIVKVYGGNIGTDSSVKLSGSFYATGDVWLGSNTQLEYVSSPVNIPEPASLLLSAMSFVFILKFRPKAATDTSVAA